MKLSKLALIAAVACGINASNLTTVSANEIQLVSCCESNCDCGQPVCGCETACEPTCCDNSCEPECGCEVACCEDTCCDSGCDSACGIDLGGCLSGDCCIGEPKSLFGSLGGIDVGGWASIGYHTKNLRSFNSNKDELQLQQAWLYAEKALDTSCGFDYGGRVDFLYGTDGPDTQAFGIANNHWDNGWDTDANYGAAMPQLYGEVGYGDTSVKFGHFYTLIGYEVVAAPDNFFYSHAYTMYNSEPFTHTGLIATHQLSDDTTVFGGYTMGWDSGFEDNGDNFLGGFSFSLTDSTDITYMSTIGRFGEGASNAADGVGGERGYMHSMVSTTTLSDNLTFINQNDWLETEDAAGNTFRSTWGQNNYLLYRVNDCLSYGARLEYWKVGADSQGYLPDGSAVTIANLQAVEDINFDVWALTFGVNYKPHSNVIIRPEVRFDWMDNRGTADAAGVQITENNEANQTTFGFDTIFLF